MTIAFGSIGTGLPKDIVKQLMDAEKIPVDKMVASKEKINEKKKVLGELIKLVEEMKGIITTTVDEKGLREYKIDTNNDLVSVDVDKNFVKPGSYQFEIVELAQKSSAMSSGFPDKDESSVGVGYIQYTLPDGETKEIYIDKENSTLEGVARLINSDESTGLRASVVNDGTDSDEPWRLVLSLAQTGDNKLANFPYFYFVDGDNDFYLEFEREARDAKIKIDGFEVEVPENKIKDLIPGANINLKKAKPGEEFTIKISEDSEAVTEKITTLIDKINAVIVFINKQNALDEKSDTSTTLGGDSVLQTLESRLRSIVFRDIETSEGTRRIGDLGIVFQRDGSLLFDKKRFNAAVSTNYQTSAQILTGWINSEGKAISGFIDNLQTVTNGLLRLPDGILAIRNKGLQSNIDQIDRRIESRQRMLEQKERMLKDKFSRLEGTISRIKGQGAGLAALSQAAAANPVAQLG